MIACNKDQNSKSWRDSSRAGQVTFDREIIGINFSSTQTGTSGGVTVHNTSGSYSGVSGRSYESQRFFSYSSPSGNNTLKQYDWVAISSDKLSSDSEHNIPYELIFLIFVTDNFILFFGIIAPGGA